jgi:hypothetical protein
VKILRARHPLEGRDLQVMGGLRRRDVQLLLVALPDGSRTLVPAQWTDWKPANNADGLLTLPEDNRERHIAPLGDLLRLRTIVNALLDRESMSRPEPIADEEGGHATEIEFSRTRTIAGAAANSDRQRGGSQGNWRGSKMACFG